MGGKETMNFWDVERLRFRIEQGPKWLTIDEATGLLTGTPDRVEKADVVITASLARDEQRLDEAALKWGIEKVVSSSTVTVATARQHFVIESALRTGSPSVKKAGGVGSRGASLSPLCRFGSSAEIAAKAGALSIMAATASVRVCTKSENVSRRFFRPQAAAAVGEVSQPLHAIEPLHEV